MLSDEFEVKLALMESIGIVLLADISLNNRISLEETIIDIRDEIINTYNKVNLESA